MEPPIQMVPRTTRAATFLEFREILDDYVTKSINTMKNLEECDVLRRCKPVRTIGFVEKYRNFHLFLLNEIDQYNKNVDVSRSNLRNGKVGFEKVNFNLTAIKLWEEVLERLYKLFHSEATKEKYVGISLKSQFDELCTSVKTTLKATEEIGNCIEKKTVIGMELIYIEFIVEKEKEYFEQRCLNFEYHLNAQTKDIKRQTASLMEFTRNNPEKQILLKKKEDILIQRYLNEIFYYQLCIPFEEYVKIYEEKSQKAYPPPQHLILIPSRAQMNSHGPISMAPGGYVQEIPCASTSKEPVAREDPMEVDEAAEDVSLESELKETDKTSISMDTENNTKQEFSEIKDPENVEMLDETDHVKEKEEDDHQNIFDFEQNSENILNKPDEVMMKDADFPESVNSVDNQNPEELIILENEDLLDEIQDPTPEEELMDPEEPATSNLFIHDVPECNLQEVLEDNASTSDMIKNQGVTDENSEKDQESKEDGIQQKEPEDPEHADPVLQELAEEDEQIDDNLEYLIQNAEDETKQVPELQLGDNQYLGSEGSPSPLSDRRRTDSESSKGISESRSSEASTPRHPSSASKSPRSTEDSTDDRNEDFLEYDGPSEVTTRSDDSIEQKEDFVASEVKNPEDQDLEDVKSPMNSRNFICSDSQKSESPDEEMGSDEQITEENSLENADELVDIPKMDSENIKAEVSPECYPKLNYSQQLHRRNSEENEVENSGSPKGETSNENGPGTETVPTSSAPEEISQEMNESVENGSNSENMETSDQTLNTGEGVPTTSSPLETSSEVRSSEVDNSEAVPNQQPADNVPQNPDEDVPNEIVQEAEEVPIASSPDTSSVNSSDSSDDPRFPEVLTRNRERQPYRRFIANRTAPGRRSSVVTESSTDSSIESSSSSSSSDTSEGSSIPESIVESIESDDTDVVPFMQEDMIAARPVLDETNAQTGGQRREGNFERSIPPSPDLNAPVSTPENAPRSGSTTPNIGESSQENLMNNSDNSSGHPPENSIPVEADNTEVSPEEFRSSLENPESSTESASRDDNIEEDEVKETNPEITEGPSETREVKQNAEVALEDVDSTENFEVHTPRSYNSSDYSSNPPSPEHVQPPQMEATFFGDSAPEANPIGSDDIIVVRGSRDTIDDGPEGDVFENSDAEDDEEDAQNSQDTNRIEDVGYDVFEESEDEEEKEEPEQSSESAPQVSLKRRHTEDDDDDETSEPSSKEPKLD